jgi:hypothetical protein
VSDNNQNIHEGIPGIDIHIGAVELKKVVFKILHAQWLDYSGGFHISIDQLKFYSCDNHENLDRANPDKDAIYHFFNNGKKLSNVKKGFNCELTIPAALWAEFEEAYPMHGMKLPQSKTTKEMLQNFDDDVHVRLVGKGRGIQVYH